MGGERCVKVVRQVVDVTVTSVPASALAKEVKIGCCIFARAVVPVVTGCDVGIRRRCAVIVIIYIGDQIGATL